MANIKKRKNIYLKIKYLDFVYRVPASIFYFLFYSNSTQSIENFPGGGGGLKEPTKDFNKIFTAQFLNVLRPSS